MDGIEIFDIENYLQGAGSLTSALSGMTARLFWGLAVGLALVGCASHPPYGGVIPTPMNPHREWGGG